MDDKHRGLPSADNILTIRIIMYKIYAWIKYNILLQRLIDPSLFVCTTETFLYSDLLHLEEQYPITLYDTAVSLNSLLNTSLHDLTYTVRYNRALLYKSLYYYFNDVCDWEQIHINTGALPYIKTVLKRLKHHI